MDKETKQEIAMSKEEKRKQAREARMKEKQLEKQRARVHSEMVAYQKRAKRKLKKRLKVHIFHYAILIKSTIITFKPFMISI